MEQTNQGYIYLVQNDMFKYYTTNATDRIYHLTVHQSDKALKQHLKDAYLAKSKVIYKTTYTTDATNLSNLFIKNIKVNRLMARDISIMYQTSNTFSMTLMN